jgi:hypothetical protein
MDRIPFPYELRDRHLYIPGKTRHGKSTLLFNIIIQDIYNGAGVGVIDPKGDLVKKLIHWIPPHRVDDCIYLTLKHPIPIDLFSYQNDDERESLVGDIKYLAIQGQNMEGAPFVMGTLDDLVSTILDYNEIVEPEDRATFLDLVNFLKDESRRDVICNTIKNRRLKKRWKDDWPNDRTVASITHRLTSILNSRSLSKVLGCPNPKLNMRDVMENRKVLLVNLGGINDPKKIFGTLLIANIRQMAMRRESIPEEERIPFFLFVDEFQYFQTQDFDEILSFAAGYGLRLALANQTPSKLTDKICDALFGNVDNYIVFKLGLPKDTLYFKHFFPSDDDGPDHTILYKLPKGHAWYKIADEEPIFKDTPPPPRRFNAASPAQTILNRTITEYSCDSTAPQGTPKKDGSIHGKSDNIAASGATKPPRRTGKEKDD